MDKDSCCTKRTVCVGCRRDWRILPRWTLIS